MHGYSPYEYEWINVVNLSCVKWFITKFEGRKELETKATDPTRKATKEKVVIVIKQ